MSHRGGGDRIATRADGANRYGRLVGVGLPALGVLLYALAVLWFVAHTGDTGLRCVFGPRVKELAGGRWSPEIRLDVAPDLKGPPPPPVWSPGPPRAGTDGDRLTMLGGIEIQNYSDVIRGMRHVRDRVGEYAEVRWLSESGPRFGLVLIERPPWPSYLWSVLWLVQEMAVLAIGAWVLLRRPRDESARVFFWLCVATVVAFIGGYHWAVIAAEPLLIYPFAALIVFVPILSLHFYLILPRPHPFFLRHRRLLLGLMYAAPTLTATALWVAMSWSRWGQGAAEVDTALIALRGITLGYIVFSVLLFVVCLACLVVSYRRARTTSERNQVRWVLAATILSVPPIAWLVIDSAADPARLGMTRTAWPMSIVSLLYTVAYAFCITRYKLLQAERVLNRSLVYMVFSIAAGLVYSGLIVVGALVVGERLLGAEGSLLGTFVACITAIVLLELSGAVRQRLQRAFERRFHREKYKFDQAMRRMSQAVGNLVDGATLGRRLLEAAGDVLHAEWGAIYLAESPGEPLRLAASSGPEPDEDELPQGNALVARFRAPSGNGGVIAAAAPARGPLALASPVPADPATDAMIALGGEVAAPLEIGDELAGLLVLGPKRSGQPYEDEELAFLSALASVATLALRSADAQRTLEALNVEVRHKVEKIAEQQRRILILQEQISRQRRANRAEATAMNEDTEPENEETSLPAIAAPPEPTTRDNWEDRGPFGALKGSSAALRELVQVARKVAQSSSAVLLRGESGTGKERLAEAIHQSSPRAAKPFVKVHCAALSQNLLESELFGHVKGAFTDAKSDRVGRFQQADGGTLFLDEIGDINLEVQTKLLRVLQEMSFEKVGSSQTIKVDVRILAATHQDLEVLIRQGRFREDLFYRLNVISLRVPALRERRDDIFELAIHFMNEAAARLGKSVLRIDESAIEALVDYPWPGNIRELENAIEHAVVLADGPAIGLADLPPEIRGLGHTGGGMRKRRTRVAATAIGVSRARALAAPPAKSEWDDDAADPEWAAYEHQRLVDALAETGGNKAQAARVLGMPRSTFFSKLKKHGLA